MRNLQVLRRLTAATPTIKEVGMAPATPMAASLIVHAQNQIDEAFLAEALQEVLPPVLVGATNQAQEVVPDLPPVREGEAKQPDLPSFAAALGTTAAEAVSRALIQWLSRRQVRSILGSLPNWLRPAVAPTARPVVVTLTDFANSRSRYVRLVENGESVLISRHGMVIAALIPVEPGAYEEAVHPEAAQHRHVEGPEWRGSAPDTNLDHSP